MYEQSNDFATGYAIGRDSNNSGNCGNGMFGGDMWSWWVIILLLFGWGNNGYGGGYGGVGENYVLATDFATIERKLDSVNAGLCDGFYAQNTNMLNGFASVQQALCQGFSGLNSSIANLGYQQAQHACNIQGAIKDVAYGNAMNTSAIQQQISSCCCDIEKMNMQSRFDAQAYNCNTLSAIDKLGDRIIDYMSNEKVQALRDENQALRLAASQAKQNEYLISRLDPNPCPTPAYVVQPPQPVTFPTNCCGGVNYAAYNNGGCGCGCN
jgi:hypothetical protein